MGRWIASLASIVKEDGVGSDAQCARANVAIVSVRSDEGTTKTAAGSGETVAGPRKKHVDELL